MTTPFSESIGPSIKQIDHATQNIVEVTASLLSSTEELAARVASFVARTRPAQLAFQFPPEDTDFPAAGFRVAGEEVIATTFTEEGAYFKGSAL